MGLDYEKYRPLVADLDLTDEKKDELIHAVWSMMKSFVDASFGDDPVQLALDQKENGSGQADRNKVRSKNSEKHQTTEGIEP